MKVIVFALMLLPLHGGAPVQLAAEPTLTKCQADIDKVTTVGIGFYGPNDGSYFCRQKTERLLTKPVN